MVLLLHIVNHFYYQVRLHSDTSLTVRNIIGDYDQQIEFTDQVNDELFAYVGRIIHRVRCLFNGLDGLICELFGMYSIYDRYANRSQL